MKMIINGVEVNFDPFDVDQADNYDKAVEGLNDFKDELEAAEKASKAGDIARVMVKMFRSFLLTATGTDVLGDCKNSQVASEAYYEFLGKIGEMKNELSQKYDAKRVR